MDILKECILAFIFGGLLCTVGQIFIDITKLTPARILVTYVTSGVFLGAVGIYQPLIKIFGCGATLPLTGFGNVIAQGVKTAVETTGFSGILTGGLTAAAGGITLAVVLAFLTSLLTRPKTK